jgi:riboflavin kinase/FMN adenylyltransferase
MVIVEWPEFVAGALISPFPNGKTAAATRKTALTIGVFDGIHRGHRLLIEKIVQKGPEMMPVVITFKRNPKESLKKQAWEGDILSLNQRLTIFENSGLEALILIDFTENFSKLTGKEFLDLLRVRGNPGYLAVGNNFHCGYRMDTNAARIKALYGDAGIPVEVLKPVLAGSLPVSSSRIREALASGDLAGAACLLGRKVEFDLAGIRGVLRDGGRFYDTAALGRLLPPPGSYSALLYGERSAAGVTAQVVIERGGVFIPPGSGMEQPERIEFLC